MHKEPWGYSKNYHNKAPQRLHNREWNEDIAHVQFEHIWERLRDEPANGQYSFGPQQQQYNQDYGFMGTHSDQEYTINDNQANHEFNEH